MRYTKKGLGKREEVVRYNGGNTFQPASHPQCSTRIHFIVPHILITQSHLALDKTGSSGWSLKVEIHSVGSIATCKPTMCPCVQACVCALNAPSPSPPPS